jgi:activator of 2-hydroxyglutaryl-CoA dehydratase
VFAESEVISLKNQGAAPEGIARAVHLSVVQRLAGMLHRVGITGEVVFTGGVARNRCMVALLEEQLAIKIHVPEAPDITGALGAALAAGAMDITGKEAMA